jgi:cytidylate kinase
MTIIAISRGTFSGGEALAKCVAERLGYRCVGREAILDEAAKGYGVPAEELTAAMEKPPSFWGRVAGARTAHLTFVRAALCAHARGGNLVYHGLVGHLLLPGISHVIRVRVIADPEFRIKVAMQQQNLARAAAIAHIEKIDKERRHWIRFLFDVEWDDPYLYDVVLNLSRTSLATACDMVARMTEQEEFKPTATSMKALQDLTLSSRVSAMLASDARTKAADLRVTADNGRVTITGVAASPTVGDAIHLVVRQVEGVKEVRSEVTTVAPVPYAGI